MNSHPPKPVKQLSSQTVQDTASQSCETYWNYFHSNHNNNTSGQHMQGGGGGGRSSAPHQPRCCPLSPAHCWEHPRSIHPLPHIHPSPHIRPSPHGCIQCPAALCIAARLGNGRSHPKEALASLLCPCSGAKRCIPACACRRAKALLVLAAGEHKQHRASPAQVS